MYPYINLVVKDLSSKNKAFSLFVRDSLFKGSFGKFKSVIISFEKLKLMS